jgi:hypothetical protein
MSQTIANAKKKDKYDKLVLSNTKSAETKTQIFKVEDSTNISYKIVKLESDNIILKKKTKRDVRFKILNSF